MTLWYTTQKTPLFSVALFVVQQADGCTSKRHKDPRQELFFCNIALRGRTKFIVSQGKKSDFFLLTVNEKSHMSLPISNVVADVMYSLIKLEDFRWTTVHKFSGFQMCHMLILYNLKSVVTQLFCNKKPMPG